MKIEITVEDAMVLVDHLHAYIELHSDDENQSEIENLDRICNNIAAYLVGEF